MGNIHLEGCLFSRNGDVHIVCVCLNICRCEDQPEVSIGYLPPSMSTHLTEPGTHQFGQAGQRALRIFLLHTPNFGNACMYA